MTSRAMSTEKDGPLTRTGLTTIENSSSSERLVSGLGK